MADQRTTTQPNPPRRWHAARRTGIRLLIAYGAICLLMVCMETSLVYPIPRPTTLSPTETVGLEEVRFASGDGVELHGLFCPHPKPRFGLLYFHGNGEDVSDNADLIRWYCNLLNASVFVFDYRGYGLSAGSPYEAGLIEDGLAAQRWLGDRMNVDPSELVLMGRSIGGGVAVAVASQQGARALVLQNTFAEMTEVAAAKFPWLPIRLLMRNRYPSADRIQAYDGPLLQSHGTADTVVPFEQGKKLFEASPSNHKRFIEVPDGNHNGPLPDYCYEALVEFLEGL